MCDIYGLVYHCVEMLAKQNGCLAFMAVTSPNFLDKFRYIGPIKCVFYYEECSYV